MGVKKSIPFGEKFGRLEIIKEVESKPLKNGKNQRMVEVQCDCGRKAIKALVYVKNGQTKSCGECYEPKPLHDLTGNTINSLYVVGISHKNHKELVWDCKCECGEDVKCSGRSLRAGSVYNCGKCATKYGTFKIGDRFKNNSGDFVTIIGFPKTNWFSVKFDEVSGGAIIDVENGNLRNGSFKNPMKPVVAGVGYHGIGPYIAKIDGKHTSEYADWNSMMKRCYKQYPANITYRDKFVCEEWHNFQIFAEWSTSQVNYDAPGWELDKDLLVKGNKIYSPTTCCYLPREINLFVVNKRMNDLPLGVDRVYYANNVTKYRVQARENNKNVGLGIYNTVEEAFLVYKKHKEDLAKKLADKYKNIIDNRAYDALMSYTINIED